MTETALPGAAAVPPVPAPVALSIALGLVTRHHLRLVDRHDGRLGELAGGYELGAASWTGPRAAFVGFYRPPADGDEARRDLIERCRAAAGWAHRRLIDQKAERSDILLIALGPVGSIPAPATEEGVRLGVAVVDVERGTAEARLPIPSGMPRTGELRASARSVRRGAPAPTLAAVDLAERQTVAGGYAQPTRQALGSSTVVTYGLIGSFIAIFLAEKALISFDVSSRGSVVSLLDFGAIANVRPYSAEWWRYVSSAFLHDDVQIFHVIGNSLAMFFIGRLVEQLYGRLVLVSVFLLTAVAGGLLWLGASALGLAQQPGVSIGASGGISGLMGLLIMLGRVQGRDVPVGVATSIRQYVTTYIVLTLLFGFFLSRVNNFAHIGGFAAGVLLSLILAPMAQVGGRSLRRHEQAALTAVVAAGALALGIAAYHLSSALSHAPPA
ncbi:MAG: rhomboid family intramembrane serine protease [Candidatus Dormibacteria bacterium]